MLAHAVRVSLGMGVRPHRPARAASIFVWVCTRWPPIQLARSRHITNLYTAYPPIFLPLSFFFTVSYPPHPIVSHSLSPVRTLHIQLPEAKLVPAVYLYSSDTDTTTMSAIHNHEEIFKKAMKHENSKQQRKGKCFPLLKHGKQIAWVKYGRDENRLWKEYCTQKYIWEELDKHRKLRAQFRVPKVEEFFTYPENAALPYVFIVMEYVPGPTARECLENASQAKRDLLMNRIAYSLGALLSLSPSMSTPPGPAGDAEGGIIVHLLFGNQYNEPMPAPKRFYSTEELQTHIQKVVVSLKSHVILCFN